MLKKIEAIIREDKVNDVKGALSEIGRKMTGKYRDGFRVHPGRYPFFTSTLKPAEPVFSGRSPTGMRL
jgi:hypothetical protein